MTTTGDLRIDDWVVHRPNVARSVAARVPGIDAEEATARALEKMVRIVATGGTIDDAAPYWRRAAVNEAISMTRESGRTRPVEDDTLDGLTPPVAGAELDAERRADVSMLRAAMSDLADEDREILFDRHVHDKAATDIAAGLGVRPHAVTMRLRRAEECLAGAFAAAHAQGVNEPECRATRASMHDYLKGRLLPRRQRRLEVHMYGCGECTRVFIDVREVSWMLRDLGQHLIGGAMVTGAVGGADGVAGAAGAGRPRSFGKKETAVAGGVLAALAISGGAAAYVLSQPDQPPVEAIDGAGAAGGPGGGGDGGDGGAGSAEEPTTDEQPPPVPPADPQPRPATTPKEDAAAATADEAPAAAEPAPTPVTEGEPGDAPEQPANPPAEPEDPTDPPVDPPEPQTEPPAEPPEVPADPPGLGTALEDLLADLGLSDLPGIDLATTTPDEIWELSLGTSANAADGAESATGA